MTRGKPAVNSYRLLDGIRALQPVARQRACRRTRIAADVELVQREDGSRGLVGLCRCGSLCCPVCAGHLYATRADEIQSACETWRLSGGQVVMLTLTIRHAISDDLATAVRGIAQAYRKLRAGRAGQSLWRALGIEHSVRAIELTHGPNGWHPHLHVLLFVRGWDWLELRSRISQAWQDAVGCELGSRHVPDAIHGATVTVSTSDTYIAKLGLEVSSIGKRAHGPNRSPWEIAADASDGDEASRELWRKYSAAMLGRQRITWSAHSKRFFGLERERDELAVMLHEDRLGVVTVLARWTATTWDAGKLAARDWTSRVMAGNEPLPWPDRHGVTLRDRAEVGTGPPRLPTAARCEPYPGLRQAGERQEAAIEAELFPERRWYLKQRALGRVRLMFEGMKKNEPACAGPSLATITTPT